MDTDSDSDREAKKGAGKQRRVTFFDLLAASEGAHSKTDLLQFGGLK